MSIPDSDWSFTFEVISMHDFCWRPYCISLGANTVSMYTELLVLAFGWIQPNSWSILNENSIQTIMSHAPYVVIGILNDILEIWFAYTSGGKQKQKTKMFNHCNFVFEDKSTESKYQHQAQLSQWDKSRLRHVYMIWTWWSEANVWNCTFARMGVPKLSNQIAVFLDSWPTFEL